MIDFPGSPTLGETFTDGTTAWVWDGTKWQPAPAATGGGIVTVAHDATLTGLGTNIDPLGVVIADAADVTTGTDNIRALSSLRLREVMGDDVAGLATIEQTVVPAINEVFVLADAALTQPEGDARYVEQAGDVMTGPLDIQNQLGFSRLSLSVANAVSRASLQFRQGGVAAWDFHMPGFGGNLGNLVFGRHNPATGVLVDNALTIVNTPGGVVGSTTFNFLGTVMLDRAPTQDLQAANKLYVDQLVTGSQQLIGGLDANTGEVNYSVDSGFPDGPLVPANVAGSNHYVIVVVAGTPPSGPPETQVRVEVGDWFISDGTQWMLLMVGDPDLLGTNIGLIPSVFGEDNVQDALEQAELEVDGKIDASGDTMLGPLILAADPIAPLQAATMQYVLANDASTRVLRAGDTMTGELIFSDDGEGVTFAGFGRLYKVAGGGMVLRESTGGQQPQIEDNNGTNRRDILDTTNGDARYTRKTGDTMTGSLVVQSQSTSNNNRFIFQKSSTAYLEEILLEARTGGARGAAIQYDGGLNRSDEGRFHFYTENGGYSWGKSFNTTIGSPPGIYITGDSSAQSHTTRSEAYLKQAIRYDEAAATQAFDALRPAMFKLNEPPWPPVDGNGNLKPNPYPKPENRDRFGFIVDDMVSDPLLALVVNQDHTTGERGWDLGQVIALLVAKVRALEAEIVQLKARPVPR